MREADAEGTEVDGAVGVDTSIRHGGAKVGEYRGACGNVVTLGRIPVSCGKLAVIEMADDIMWLTLISPSLILQEGKTLIQALSTTLISVTFLVFHMRLAASKLNSWPGCVCMCLTKALFIHFLSILPLCCCIRAFMDMLVRP